MGSYSKKDNGPYSVHSMTANGCLREVSGDRIIGRLLRPAVSPCLTPSDYCLWGSLNDDAYKSIPQTQTHKHTHRTNQRNKSGAQHRHFIENFEKC